MNGPASDPESGTPGSPQVEVSDLQGHLRVDPGRSRIWCAACWRARGCAASISVALVDDAAIHALNRRHPAGDHEQRDAPQRELS